MWHVGLLRAWQTRQISAHEHILHAYVLRMTWVCPLCGDGPVCTTANWGSRPNSAVCVCAGQFLNEMQEVGELSPAVSPVKSPTGSASAFAPPVKQEDATADAGPVAEPFPAAAGDTSDSAQHDERPPLDAFVEAPTDGLRGGSADERVANGGPVHAASGELEGTEHLHSGATGTALTSGENGEATAEAAALADRVALVAACLKAEASAHTGPASQLSLSLVTSARSSEGAKVEPGSQDSIDIGGQSVSNGMDHSGDMVTDGGLGEARSAPGQDGTVQTGAAPAAVTAAGQSVPGQPTTPAQEQQFTCKVCDITTSTETHMQVRPRLRPAVGLFIALWICLHHLSCSSVLYAIHTNPWDVSLTRKCQLCDHQPSLAPMGLTLPDRGPLLIISLRGHAGAPGGQAAPAEGGVRRGAAGVRAVQHHDHQRGAHGAASARQGPPAQAEDCRDPGPPGALSSPYCVSSLSLGGGNALRPS